LQFDEIEDESGTSYTFVIIMIELICVVLLAFSYWQWRVVCRCKQYFEEKHWAGVNASQQQQNATHSTALVSNVSPLAPPAYSALMAEEGKKH
jgi:hypothetical protein